MSTLKHRAHKSLSIHKRHNAIMDLRKWMTNTAVAAKSGVLRNTVSTWKKNSAKVIAANNSASTGPKRRWIHSRQHEDLDAALLKWFHSVKDRHVPMWQGNPRKGSSVCQELEIENSRPQMVGLKHNSIRQHGSAVYVGMVVVVCIP